jgi:tRNA uridine 5-carboxymethylaminomethyl modification enzyme
MFTSRAEFRLHLRIDNADRRLTPHGRRLGLIGDEAWAEYERKQARMSALSQLLSSVKVTPESLGAAGFAALPATAGLTWAQLLKRPEVTIEPMLGALRETLAQDPLLAELSAAMPQILKQEAKAGTAVMRNEARAVETDFKFAGYIEQQKKSIEKLKSAEAVKIPEWIEYSAISGLSREMRETLDRVRPITIGQASRLPGVTPAALGLVHVSIRIQGAKRLAS